MRNYTIFNRMPTIHKILIRTDYYLIFLCIFADKLNKEYLPRYEVYKETIVVLIETRELLVESFNVDDNTPVSPGTSLSRQKNWEDEEDEEDF